MTETRWCEIWLWSDPHLNKNSTSCTWDLRKRTTYIYVSHSTGSWFLIWPLNMSKDTFTEFPTLTLQRIRTKISWLNMLTWVTFSTSKKPSVDAYTPPPFVTPTEVTCLCNLCVTARIPWVPPMLTAGVTIFLQFLLSNLCSYDKDASPLQPWHAILEFPGSREFLKNLLHDRLASFCCPFD